MTEDTLLGSCMIAGVAPPCNPGDFYSDKNRTIALAMRELEAEQTRPDLVATAERVRQLSEGKITGEMLSSTYEKSGSSENIGVYADIVSQLAAARRVQELSVRFIAECGALGGKDVREMLSQHCKAVMAETDTKGAARDIAMREACKVFITDLDHRMTREKSLVGLSTGLKELDRATCGLNPQDFIVIAARPSMGKTAFALNIGSNVAMDGHKVLIFSLEMPRQSLMQRLVARYARVPLSSLRSGEVRSEEYRAVGEAIQRLFSTDIIIVDSPLTELDILRKARRYAPDLVIIDYLQLINPSKRTGNANYDYGEVSKAMKNLAKELEIPVVLLSQLTRSNERENRRPRLSDLRDTGQLEQDADAVVLLHADNGNHTLGTREVILAKQRQGDCYRWNLAFLREYQSFEPLEVRRNG